MLFYEARIHGVMDGRSGWLQRWIYDDVRALDDFLVQLLEATTNLLMLMD
jgi:hypothetical protein